MKILVLDTSPLEDESDCAVILGPMLKTLVEGGAQVEHIRTARLDLRACIGPHCMAHAYGRCFIGDDFGSLLPAMARADILLLAGPVEGNGTDSLMSRLLTRLGSYSKKLTEYYRANDAEGDIPDLGVVALATSRTDDIDIFDRLIGDIEQFCFRHGKTTGRPTRLSGLVLRPEANLLRHSTSTPTSAADFTFASLEKAANALVDTGNIDYETAADISLDWPGTSQQAFVRSVVAALKGSAL